MRLVRHLTTCAHCNLKITVHTHCDHVCKVRAFVNQSVDTTDFNVITTALTQVGGGCALCNVYVEVRELDSYHISIVE